MHAPTSRCRALVALLGLCAAGQAPAQPAADRRLADLSLEDLGQIQITSVSKQAERLADVPTSVFVITAADISRSGATSLPELLCLAPNLQVARVSAFEHTISARGFHSQSANKLLVLIDGRPVHGVINLITRAAGATGGTLISASAKPGESRASLRIGQVSKGVSWRVFGTRRDLQDTRSADGTRIDDAGHITHAGARADGRRSDDPLEAPLPARWERRLLHGAVQLQAYVHAERRVVPTFGVAVLPARVRQHWVTVRAPSRLDHDTYVPGEPPFLLRGVAGVAPERATVLELGYRGQPAPGLTISATAHPAEHGRLRTQEIDPSFTYVSFANGMRGHLSGLEVWDNWQATRRWRLHLGLNRLVQELRLQQGSNDVGGHGEFTAADTRTHWPRSGCAGLDWRF